jgi:predicted phage terminase large subunit-like protein
MQSIARVTKLRRAGEKARSMRKPPTNELREPGPLLDLVPQISPQLRRPDHLAPIAEVLERALDESIEVCISVPPRHGKTTLLLHAIVWILMKDPTATILYASYAHGFAAKQVRKAMRLAERAGIKLGDTRRRDEWNTAEGGGVKACGVGGQITGEGFRVIFVDDPHKNRAEAESRQIRERVIEGFRDDIYTRQDPRGTSVFVVATRWHEHDLTGVLSRAEPANDADDAVEPFGLINLPAIRPSNDNAARIVALAPDLFSLERLVKLRSRVGEYGWASLYMGSPRPRGGALFTDAVLLERLDDSSSYRYSIGLDLARTARTRSDWNVATVFRLDLATNLIDVVEVVREQGVLTDKVREGEIDEGFARRLNALQARYPGARTVMYTGRDEENLLALLAEHATYPCEVEGIPAAADKWLRAQPYAAAWNEGRVRMLRTAPWASTFVAEHVGFTGLKGGRDDQVDAGAAGFDALADEGTGLAEAMRRVTIK